MDYSSLTLGQRVGIMCADGPAMTSQLLEACGVTPDIPIAIQAFGDRPEFGNILYSQGEFDYDRLEREVVEGFLRRGLSDHCLYVIVAYPSK